ncbi:hypothetical protein MHC_03285 [Mycoplasma haemocanis str. Illinois]|uniref:Uncharacterized protein n=1 Tax=Mycoplasma haemocanis (strain Illinois) TaxID=1111676 RepID=H6N795_MYCHN|nr:hypothetical protein [Mycoplasma haemocanis]AEW45517.1 hypothetical protein MHC_03285 [Mycoplasma haemocanis str. Illinois]
MNLLKLVVGAAGIAGVGALGTYYSGVFSSKKNDIRGKLIKSKWTILEDFKDEHKSHWSTALSKYKEKHTGNTNLTESQLKDICKNLLNSEDDKNYEEARRYCVVPRKISERLSDLNLQLLDITNGNSPSNKNQTQWTSLATKYKTSGTGNIQLDDLAASSINDANTNWTNLRDKCKAVSEKDHWSEKYDELVDNSKTWCTLQGFDTIPK